MFPAGGGRGVRRARWHAADACNLVTRPITCVLSPSSVLEDRHCPVGDHLPFWVGNVLEDEEAAVDAYGKRLQPIDPEDAFQVQWLGVFDPNGRITNSVVGSWQLMRACGH
eukprot:1088569-Pleurochrysis_carterae.AAC.1